LKILAIRIRDAISTKGEEIRKEKVTPSGKPALVKPMNKGTEEQEQKGVIVPSKAPRIFPDMPPKRPRMRLLLSGGK
jgi:hypothetical protein